MCAAHNNQSLACANCGYNMTGLPDTQPCPECGKTVFQAMPFYGVPLDFVRTLHFGARFVTLAYTALGLSILMYMTENFVVHPLVDHLFRISHPILDDPAVFEVLVYQLPRGIYWTGRYSLLAAGVLFGVGWWLLTKPTKSQLSHNILASHTPWLRLVCFCLAVFVAAQWLQLNHVVLLVATTVCLGLFLYDSASYFRKIAALSGSSKLTKRIGRCRIANIVQFVVIVLVWIIVPLSYAIEPVSTVSDRAMVYPPQPSAYDTLRYWVVVSIFFLGFPTTFLNTVAVATLSSTLKSARRLSPEATA